MKTCKTCIHWTRRKGDDLVHENHCVVGSCDSEKFVFQNEGMSRDGFSYWDAAGELVGRFETGEDFGCVHHQGRGFIAVVTKLVTAKKG